MWRRVNICGGGTRPTSALQLCSVSTAVSKPVLNFFSIVIFFILSHSGIVTDKVVKLHSVFMSLAYVIHANISLLLVVAAK